MMGKLSQLFAVKKTPELKVSEETNLEENEVQLRVTYYKSGFNSCVNSMGSPMNFLASLQNVYQSFEEQC